MSCEASYILEEQLINPISMIIESEADLAAKVCVLTKQLGSPKVTSTEDYISAMSWSQCGKYFALGDHSGRLIIFGEHDGDLKYFTEVTGRLCRFLRISTAMTGRPTVRWQPASTPYTGWSATTICRYSPAIKSTSGSGVFASSTRKSWTPVRGSSQKSYTATNSISGILSSTTADI